MRATALNSNKRIPRRRAGGLLLFFTTLLLLSGCVQVETPREPWQRTPLIVTRDRQGTTLHLRTQKGQRYNILYLDPGGGQGDWRPLPQATQLEGTGETIEIVDTHPLSSRRRYRPQTLLAMPADRVPRELR